MKDIAVTSDSCATACLTRKLIIDELDGFGDEVDCQGHARCTIAGGAVAKALSKHITALLMNK